MSRRSWLMLALGLAALLSMACSIGGITFGGGGEEEARPTAAPSTPAGEERMATPMPTGEGAGGEAVATPEATEEASTPSARGVAEPFQDLTWEGLRSYRVEIRAQIFPADEAVPPEEMVVREDVLNSTTFSMTLKLVKGGDSEEPQGFRIIRVGDTVWSDFGEMGWMQAPADEGESGITLPLIEDLVPSDIEDVKKEGTEKVDGVKAEKYTFRYAQAGLGDLGFGDLTEAFGTLWVAPVPGGKGRYVVRLRLEGKGEVGGIADYEGLGRFVLEMRVYDVGQEIVIEPPASPTGLTLPGFPEGDFPQPEGTQIQLAMGNQGGMLLVPLSLEETADFYRQALQDLGWSLTADDAAEGLVSLQFEKEGSTVSLLISEDASTGQTSVLVSGE